MIKFWLTLLSMGMLFPGEAKADCAIGEPCIVDGERTYYAAEPSNWDGSSPLPVAVFFHGYRGSGNAVINNPSLVRAFTDLGILLIAPNGVGGSWAAMGSPGEAREDRDEVAFVDAVIADAANRWPIDQNLTWITGFSLGGMLAHDIACLRGSRFAAYVPIAGVFWTPEPTACDAGPVNLRHIHGLADTMVPMSGRQIREWRQGDVRKVIGMWARHNQCGDVPDRTEEQGALICKIWDSCRSGKELQLCLHKRGHMTPPGWVAESFEWVKSVASDD
ncbi:MAG: hypothetical protein OEU36_04945 [Gammaproteobacteria bacterium]|nr:hypothetical protein [Gammaproteobacteria bacterium]